MDKFFANPFFVLFATVFAVVALVALGDWLSGALKWLRRQWSPDPENGVDVFVPAVPNAGFHLKTPNSAVRRHYYRDEDLGILLRNGWGQARSPVASPHVLSDRFREA